MDKIRLVFKGILQSWGVPEYWEKYRRTNFAPTESAVYGLLGCALGLERGSDELRVLMEDVKISIPQEYENADILIDDQLVTPLDSIRNTEKNPRMFVNADGKNLPDGKQVLKYYLEDTVRYAEVTCGNVYTKDIITEALLHPRYPYHLGRYCCTPSRCVLDIGGENDTHDIQA